MLRRCEKVLKRVAEFQLADKSDEGRKPEVSGPALGAMDQRRYSPSRFLSADKRRINGSPDMSDVSTSHVERQNLTMRM